MEEDELPVLARPLMMAEIICTSQVNWPSSSCICAASCPFPTTMFDRQDMHATSAVSIEIRKLLQPCMSHLTTPQHLLPGIWAVKPVAQVTRGRKMGEDVCGRAHTWRRHPWWGPACCRCRGNSGRTGSDRGRGCIPSGHGAQPPCPEGRLHLSAGPVVRSPACRHTTLTNIGMGQSW